MHWNPLFTICWNAGSCCVYLYPLLSFCLYILLVFPSLLFSLLFCSSSLVWAVSTLFTSCFAFVFIHLVLHRFTSFYIGLHRSTSFLSCLQSSVPHVSLIWLYRIPLLCLYKSGSSLCNPSSRVLHGTDISFSCYISSTPAESNPG